MLASFWVYAKELTAIRVLRLTALAAALDWRELAAGLPFGIGDNGRRAEWPTGLHVIAQRVDRALGGSLATKRRQSAISAPTSVVDRLHRHVRTGRPHCGEQLLSAAVDATGRTLGRGCRRISENAASRRNG
jgi:hypothetical protein